MKGRAIDHGNELSVANLVLIGVVKRVAENIRGRRYPAIDVFQMGEDQTQPCSVSSTESGEITPCFATSTLVQRDVGMCSTRVGTPVILRIEI